MNPSTNAATTTAVTLSCALTLGSAVARELSGRLLSSRVGEMRLTASAREALLMERIKHHLRVQGGK